MRYEDLKTGQIVTAKDYNQMATNKWHRDYEKMSAEKRWTELPQLAFYGFYSPRTGEHRKTGFVCKTERGSHWFKFKRDAVSFAKRQI